jgi:hypothetical protein
MDDETIEALYTVAKLIRAGKLTPTVSADQLVHAAKIAEKVNAQFFKIGQGVLEHLLTEYKINIRPDVPSTAFGEVIVGIVNASCE